MTAKATHKRNAAIVQRVKNLLCGWRARQDEYRGAMETQASLENRLNSNRYEGIMTGTRWCVEDIEAALKQ